MTRTFDSNSFLVELKKKSQLSILKIVADTLTNKNVSVEYSSHTASANMSSKNELTIPIEIATEGGIVDWIMKKGVTLHETFHLLYSGNISKISTKYAKEDPTFNKWLFKDIVNCLEDARIEHIGVNHHKGAKEMITFHNAYYMDKFIKKDPDELIESPLLALCFKLKRVKIPKGIDTPIADKLFDISKDVIYEDWNGCLKTSKKVYDMYIKLKKNTQSPTSQGKKTQNTSDKDFDKTGKQSKKSIKKEQSKKEREEFTLEITKANEKYQKKLEDTDSDSDVQKEVEKEFSSEAKEEEKIDKQLKLQAEELVTKYGKEGSDSNAEGMELMIPELDVSSPTRHFSPLKASSIAKSISDVLRNKIIIGEELQTKQLNGKMNIRQAVKSVVNYEVTNEFDEHIFDREEITTPEHAVLISIDCSGSMGSAVYNRKLWKSSSKTKLAKSCETAFILGEVFETMGVNVNIRGFTTGYVRNSSYNRYKNLDILVKGWDEPINLERFFHLKVQGGTPTAEATRLATRKLSNIDKDVPLKIIFTITDGAPDDDRELDRAIAEAEDRGIIVVGVHLGYCSYRSRFEDTYKHSIIVDDVDELKDEILRVYEDILEGVSLQGGRF
jgi:hypothetical protein